MGTPCTNTRSCLPFPEEPLEAVGCAIPLPELNRIWAAQSPPDTGAPKAILPSQSAASQPRLYGMLLCSHLPFCTIFTKDLSFTDWSYSSKPGFIVSLADLWTIIHRENIYLVFPNLISTPAKSPHPFQLLLMPMKIPLYHFGPFRQLKNVLDWAGLALLPTMTAYSNVC